MLYIIFAIWAILVLYLVYIEYQYYKSVRELETDIWQELGSPNFFRIQRAFLKKGNTQLLKKYSNQTVIKYANHHRTALILTLAFPLIMLIIGILYLQLV